MTSPLQPGSFDGPARKFVARFARLAATLLAAALLQAPAASFAASPAASDAPPAEAGLPRLAGSYRSDPGHPRVFTTRPALADLARRINVAGSFSAQNFARLAEQVQSDLASKVDWEAAYTGCDLDVYLHAFSYEPRSGYAGEVRTEDQLRQAMNVRAGAASPAGSAIVAARLALYASLVKAGARMPAGAPAADAATGLARRILLAWAGRGFRDADGKPLQSPAQFCDEKGKSAEFSVGLQLGRGVVYSVQGQDLLQSLGALDATQARQLDAFHAAMFDLIRTATNNRYHHPYPMCERYSNHTAVALTGLLAIARLQDDGRKVAAVLYGADPAQPLQLPWVVYFDHAIYGESDTPIDCYPNPGPDSLTSKPSYQTATPAPGEVEDRYRNASPLQGIGYPMFALGHLLDAAEILRNAGIDAYGYRGAHKQSIESAVQYYACYGLHAGFGKIVTDANARDCPDHAQYIGKTVNDVDTVVLAGAARFPANKDIAAADAAAKKARMETYSLDPVRFGNWVD